MIGIDPNGPAHKAGLHANDIILKIDGKKISGRQSVMETITNLRPGTRVNITILRKGKEMDLPVTIAEDTRS